MKIAEIVITPAAEKTNGTVNISGNTLAYEVFGPFGQGYNVKVYGNGQEAVLSYHWRDGPESFVKFSGNEYYFDTKLIKDSKGNIILKLKGEEVVAENISNYLLCLFCVNFHYANRTGVFHRGI